MYSRINNIVRRVVSTYDLATILAMQLLLVIINQNYYYLFITIQTFIVLGRSKKVFGIYLKKLRIKCTHFKFRIAI